MIGHDYDYDYDYEDEDEDEDEEGRVHCSQHQAHARWRTAR